MKNYLRKSNLSFSWGAFIALGLSFYLLTACQKYDFDNETIASSRELKEFITTVSDFKCSLAIFEDEMSKVDFSKLEITEGSDGRKVKYLPTVIRELNIEKKLLLANQKKEVLLKKYPQLKSLDPDDFAKMIDLCISQSEEVTSFLIDRGVDLYQPTTKVIVAEVTYMNKIQLYGDLDRWLSNYNYVEVVVFTFSDGSVMVVLDDRNTSEDSFFDYMDVGGNYYYGGKQIVELTHTHLSSGIPTDADYNQKNNMKGISHSIFYNGAYYYY